MDHDYAAHYSNLEDQHWWWVGRRELIRRQLARLPLTPRARLLELGCGSGGNLVMLGAFGTVSAIEPDAGLRAHAETRGAAHVLAGAFPLGPLLADERFDVIGMFDVLEHLDDDVGALREVAMRLASSGYAVLTVPAYQWLWSHHDTLNHHRRRYTRRSLIRVVRAAGLEVVHATYFNAALFPAAAAVRLLERVLGAGRAAALQVRIPPGNAVLAHLLAAEAGVATRTGLPVGLSVLLVARVPHKSGGAAPQAGAHGPSVDASVAVAL
ncbi:MAG: class I SAM-dependent methyltransferase [Gemmatimonadaceae bacterium]|nr:class I SAM-dependent methyltransferase [Gemmatimonadaceae bacterium]